MSTIKKRGNVLPPWILLDLVSCVIIALMMLLDQNLEEQSYLPEMHKLSRMVIYNQYVFWMLSATILFWRTRAVWCIIIAMPAVILLGIIAQTDESVRDVFIGTACSLLIGIWLVPTVVTSAINTDQAKFLAKLTVHISIGLLLFKGWCEDNGEDGWIFILAVLFPPTLICVIPQKFREGTAVDILYKLMGVAQIVIAVFRVVQDKTSEISMGRALFITYLVIRKTVTMISVAIMAFHAHKSVEADHCHDTAPDAAPASPVTVHVSTDDSGTPDATPPV